MLAKEPSNFLFDLILDVETKDSLDKRSNRIMDKVATLELYEYITKSALK